MKKFDFKKDIVHPNPPKCPVKKESLIKHVFRIKTIIHNECFTRSYYSEDFDTYPSESDILSFYGEVVRAYSYDYAISNELQVEKFYIM